MSSNLARGADDRSETPQKAIFHSYLIPNSSSGDWVHPSRKLRNLVVADGKFRMLEWDDLYGSSVNYESQYQVFGILAVLFVWHRSARFGSKPRAREHCAFRASHHSGWSCSKRGSTIFQDSRAFLWIGTQDGLNRYDGYSFTVFKHSDENLKSIRHDDILCITEDTEGFLWIGT